MQESHEVKKIEVYSRCDLRSSSERMRVCEVQDEKGEQKVGSHSNMHRLNFHFKKTQQSTSEVP